MTGVIFLLSLFLTLCNFASISQWAFQPAFLWNLAFDLQWFSAGRFFCIHSDAILTILSGLAL